MILRHHSTFHHLPWNIMKHVQLPAHNNAPLVPNRDLSYGTRHHTLVEGTGLGQAAAAATTQLDIQNEAVLPRLETLRQLPSVSDTVLNLLGAYEDQARTSLQGRKPRKSGRYNSVDVIQAAPEFRWPNESYHAPAGKKGCCMMT